MTGIFVYDRAGHRCRAVALVCRNCGKEYLTKVVGDAPKSKYSCSRQCHRSLMSSGVINDILREVQDEKLAREEWAGMADAEHRALVERFRSAYVEGLDRENLMERFGEYYPSLLKRMSKADVARRAEFKKKNALSAVGRAPEKDNNISAFYGRIRARTKTYFTNRLKYLNYHYEALTNGTLGEYA